MGIANAERKYCAKTMEFEALNLFSPCEPSKQRGNITRTPTKLILSSPRMKWTQEVEGAGMLALGIQPLPQTYEETERHILRKKRDHLMIEGFHQFQASSRDSHCLPKAKRGDTIQKTNSNPTEPTELRMAPGTA
jgi:hypothetical protein